MRSPSHPQIDRSLNQETIREAPAEQSALTHISLLITDDLLTGVGS